MPTVRRALNNFACAIHRWLGRNLKRRNDINGVTYTSFVGLDENEIGVGVLDSCLFLFMEKHDTTDSR